MMLSLYVSVCGSIGLVEMELIFLIAALTVLWCKGVGAGKMLITQQCLATDEPSGTAPRLSLRHCPLTSAG